MHAVLQVAATTLAALALTPALAHVLELPGKRRLDRDGYLEVQTIYYPGFTVAGFAEVVALVVTLVLVCLTPPRAAGFWLALAALACFAAMQAIYWIAIQPVNKHWLAHTELGDAGATFFALGGATRGDWRALRDRWEHAHAARAACAFCAFVALLLSMKL